MKKAPRLIRLNGVHARHLPTRPREFEQSPSGLEIPATIRTVSHASSPAYYHMQIGVDT